jgi:catechol 2,3-dioxygenase-like lactoylglutathione lyase family enzyme
LKRCYGKIGCPWLKQYPALNGRYKSENEIWCMVSAGVGKNGSIIFNIKMKSMFKDSKAFSGFSVDDLDRAKKFYGEILELDVTKNEMGLLELHIKGSNNIVIYPKPNHIPATFTVLNFPVRNIEQTVDELINKGIRFKQYEDPIKTDEKGICRASGGPLIAWFQDPAGNILSVIQER